MSKSLEAKIALLAYCRYAKQMHYVATEVSTPGNSAADVLASNGVNLIEYEVKISMSDLKADGKKYKHVIYNPEPLVWNGDEVSKGDLKLTLKQKERWFREEYQFFEGEDKFDYKSFTSKDEAKDWLEKEIGAKSGCPDTLYYVIPQTMWENNKEKILAALHENYGVITFTNSNYGNMEVVKKAKKLHKNKVLDVNLRTIVARMSSELATLTHHHYELVAKMSEYGKMIEQRIDLGEEE